MKHSALGKQSKLETYTTCNVNELCNVKISLEAEEIKSKGKRSKRALELYRDLIMGSTLDNRQLLVVGIKKDYKTYLIELINNLEEEYDAKSTAERMLIHTIARSYIRILEYSSYHASSLNLELLSTERTSFYSMISRELDRANKQYLEAMSLLMQMKSKPMQINIKADKAYLANNQLINNSDEIIKPK